MRMLFEEHSWAWNDNPLRRHAAARRIEDRGDAPLELGQQGIGATSRADRTPPSSSTRISRFASEARYLITDWGGAMGKWGTTVVSRDRWDAAGFGGADARLRRRGP